MSSVSLDIKWRSMDVEDIPKVLLNERLCYSHPWTEGIFLDCLRSGYECWVITRSEKVIGHGILSCAAEESHLLNVCVNPTYQGQGFGRKLVSFMLERACRSARSVFLEVRPSNLAACQLYESLGFNKVGIRKDYYPAFVGREDAIVLAKELVDDD